MSGPRALAPPCRHADPACQACQRNRDRVRAWTMAHPAEARARSRRWKGKRRNRRRVRAAYRAYVARHPAACRIARYRSSAKARGATVLETVCLDAVYARDGGDCGLCYFPVPAPGAAVPLMARASIDHIQPISRGGAHTMENVRLAHVGCNVKRGVGEWVARGAAPETPF